jgi:hypothetical protein
MRNQYLISACISNNYDRVINLIRLTALLLLLQFTCSPASSSPFSQSSPLPASLAGSLTAFSSSHLPVSPSLRLLSSGYGPEDIVADSLHDPPRLLVSCASRRSEYPFYGEIETIDPVKGNRIVMTRMGEPAGLIFRPHGISLVQAAEIQYLFVISHDDQKNIHLILQYLIDGNNLIFVKSADSRLLVSPNALQAFPDGSFLVCNDAAKRNSMIEKIFRLKRGNVLYFDGRGNWTIVADKLGMPAGLTGMRNRIFISSALENKLYSYQFIDGQLTDKQQVCRIKGPDNIRINNNNLIITSHAKPIKFIRHVKDKSRKSPSRVLSVDPRSGKTTQLFYDDGTLISAASVALIFNNQLAIGQIFEPLIGFLDMNR